MNCHFRQSVTYTKSIIPNVFYEKINIPNETLYEKNYTKCNFMQYVTVYKMKLYTKCDVIGKEIIQKVTVYQLNFDEKFSTKTYRIRKIFYELQLIPRYPSKLIP